ncbi:MAG: VOC family protein, partial [Dehalococcoidia bacterium]
GYVGASLQIPGSSGLSWEVIAPRGKDSFLHRFLASPNGPGLHHVAVEVTSTAQVREAVRTEQAEPWKSPDDDIPGETIYLHPREAGRGFLWQINQVNGTASRDIEPFDDDVQTTLGIVDLNHLAHATTDRDDLAGWYARLFGGRTIWRSSGESRDAGFVTRVVEASTRQLRFEAIQPASPDSFIARFLDQRGEAMHHVTFQVGDWQRALDACRKQRVPIFGERSGIRDGARWTEAFIHPRYIGGVLVQLFWEERPGIWV